MRFIMIASQYFPIEDVSSLRIHSYCKSLVNAGADLTVLIIYPSPKGVNLNGIHEGVRYEFVSKDYRPGINFLAKMYLRFKGLYFICRFISEQNIEGVLSYHDNFLTNFIVRFFTRIKSIPYIIDKTEYPYGYFKQTSFEKLFTHLNLKLFSGFIVISNELKNFYSKFSNNVFLLPMTIDPDRFKDVDPRLNPSKYIALTFGVHNRDGLYESVLAYHKYLQINSEQPYHLFVIGDYTTLCKNFPECLRIAEYVQHHQLTDLINFLGKVPISEVPKILAGASCLLTTPSKFVSGGFPTKLGEYLLAGVPVVATNAGEISDYVKDRFDILLSEVNDLDGVAEHISFVQDNPVLVKTIAENGVKTAKTLFNATTYVKDLVKFIWYVKDT
ncbi:hypothetical protein B0E44_16300 [Flavobacterium sp. A45]|nr:hypothetical protein B0E44_16300 [Flavobacterium sp. A45]